MDDGSTDRSVEILSRLRDCDPRIKVVRFTRNFGSHTAIFAGLNYTQGEFAVFISADLQDPPSLIPVLYEKWQDGYDVVLAVRQARDDPWAKKVLANAFYRLFRAIALPDFPSFDFALLDRRVIRTLQRFNEHHHGIGPMIFWTGFPHAEVLYTRQSRRAGYSKWSLGRRIKVAIDLIVSYSYVPIRLISYLGIAVSLASFTMALLIVIGRLIFNYGSLGWPSVMVSIFFIGGVQLIVLGVLGEYIWRMSDEVRNRPLYIVMEEIGLSQHKPENPAHTSDVSEQ